MSSPPRKPSAIAEPGDRDLARLYWPARLRPASDALFAIDTAMGEVVRTSTQPMLGAIRLAWWRERLQELDAGMVPAEPRLREVERNILPRGVSGADLAALEPGWLAMLDEFPWQWATTQAIAARGALLFRLAARLAESVTSETIESAGALWALVDSARRCSDPPSRALLIEEASARAERVRDGRASPGLRPLTMLAVLALRDLERGEPFEPEGTPGRALAMLRHRLSGRIRG